MQASNGYTLYHTLYTLYVSRVSGSHCTLFSSRLSLFVSFPFLAVLPFFLPLRVLPPSLLRTHRPHTVRRCGLLLHMSYTAWSVCVCLCVGHIYMSSAKTAEPIEMPFGGRLVGLGNLDDSTHTISRGMCQHNIVKYTDSTTHYAKYGIIHCLIPA